MTGAAAFTCGDENHVGTLEHLFDLVGVVIGRLTPDPGVGAGTEATGELATDVELHVSVAHQQRLRVGVDRDELDALEADLDHPVDGVDAAAPDSDDLDHGEVVLRCCHERCLPSMRGRAPHRRRPGEGAVDGCGLRWHPGSVQPRRQPSSSSRELLLTACNVPGH
jgi:hypothetical protein